MTEPHEGEERRLQSLLRAAAGAAPAGNAAGALSAVRRRTARRRVLVRVGTAGVAAAGVGAAALVVAAPGDDLGRGPTATRLSPYRLTGALVSFDGCSDYLRYVRHRASQMVGPYGLSTPAWWHYGVINDQMIYQTRTAFSGAGLAAGASPLPSPAAHSTTTVQVAGVDEPDTVKTDGRLVVTLTGPTLRVLDTDAHVLGRLRLDGDTSGGLLLDGDRAVVLSSANGSAYEGLSPYAVPAASSSPTARAAVVDLSDPVRPRLVRTFRFDGTAVAARMIDGRVTVALRSDGPRLGFQTPSASVRAHAAKLANRHLVATSTLRDWLPGWQVEARDGSTTAWRRLADCTGVARPRHATGISTVTVVSLDPGATAPRPATSVVAAGDTVYATAGHLYVAGITTPTSLDARAARWQSLRTRIYDFSTAADGPPRFVAAGSVPGRLLNSYAMDEDAAGRLRVASTTSDRHGRTDSRITILSAVRHRLATVGHVDGLGHGEDLRAIRFLGDTAYVVTFRTFDPLYVVDLRDPRHPRVTGKLEQPGYSEYLYPLAEGRLLGVGVRIRNSEPARMLVSTYDVSDPARPQRIDSAPLARGFRFSSGSFDPHAFLSWPASRLAVVAVPNGGGAVAYRLQEGGGLSRLAVLTHGRLAAGRTLVVGDDVWAVTARGVVVSTLPALADSSWHPY